MEAAAVLTEAAGPMAAVTDNLLSGSPGHPSRAAFWTSTSTFQIPSCRDLTPVTNGHGLRRFCPDNGTDIRFNFTGRKEEPAVASSPQSFGRKKSYVKRSPKRTVDLRFSVLRGNSRIARGRCTSLNETGFGAVIAGELPLGQALSIEFMLTPSNTPVRLMASVRQRQGFVHQLDFVAPGEAQRRMIAEFWSEQLDSTL